MYHIGTWTHKVLCCSKPVALPIARSPEAYVHLEPMGGNAQTKELLHEPTSGNWQQSSSLWAESSGPSLVPRAADSHSSKE